MATPIRLSNLVTRECFAIGEGTKRRGQAGSPLEFRRKQQQCITKRENAAQVSLFKLLSAATASYKLNTPCTTDVSILQMASSPPLFPHSVLLAQFNFTIL